VTKFDANARAEFIAELARTGRICDALAAAGVTHRTFRLRRLRDAGFARAVDAAKASWLSSNDEWHRTERTCALERYRRRHPQRLAELCREGLTHWREQNPERAGAIVRGAARASSKATRKDLSEPQLRRATSLLARGFGYRRTAHTIGVAHCTLWRRMREAEVRRG